MKTSILLLSAASGLFAQSTEGTELLRQVSAAMQKVERFHVETVTETEMTGELRRSWQKSIEVLAKDGPRRLRYEVADTMASYVVVTNGGTLWRAAPDTREFIVSPVAEPFLEMKGGGPVAEMSLRRAQLALKYQVSRPVDQLASAEITGSEDLDVGGHTVPCTVVRGEYTPRGGSIGIDSWSQTFWIDRARMVILKSDTLIRGHQDPNRPFDPTTTRHRASHKVIVWNDAPAESLFAYAPPPAYRETDRLEPAFPRPAKDLIGKAAPELALPSLTGDTIKLADLRGKIVVLDFWATWCEPCRKQMPALAKLHTELNSKEVMLLGVDDDETPEKARAFMEANQYRWPSLFDGKTGAARKAFRVDTIPTLVIIDRAGTIAAYEVGASQQTETEIRAILKKLGVPLTVP